MFLFEKIMDGFVDFLSENAVWLVPITVAVISGIFGVVKFRMGKRRTVSQKAKTGDRSHIIQIGGDYHADKTRS